MRIPANRVGGAANGLDVTVPRPEATHVASPADPKELPQPEKTAPGAEPGKSPTTSEIELAVEQMNKAVKLFYQTLQFEVTKSNRIVIRVIDQNSGEILRQIPPEEFLDSFHKVADAVGVLIDRRV